MCKLVNSSIPWLHILCPCEQYKLIAKEHVSLFRTHCLVTFLLIYLEICSN
jgi:hypothetical protein